MATAPCTEQTELAALFAEHEKSIATLRTLLHDVLNKTHDDLWLLRYILSYTTPEAAEPAARFTIDYFTKNKDLIDTVLSGGKVPFEDTIAQFQCSGNHKFTQNGEPVFYVRTGISNAKALMDNVSHQSVLDFMLMNRLKTLIECDKATRAQQRIVKSVNVMDFQHFSMMRGGDSRFFKVLGKTIYANTPAAMAWSFATIVKPLLSKKTIEKSVFCPGATTKLSVNSCPYLSRYLIADDVPSFLGGKCECNNGRCIGGVPNTQTTPITGISSEGMISMAVSARNSETVDVPLAQGAGIRFEVKAGEKQQIKVRVVFKEVESGVEVDVVAKRLLEGKDGVVSGEFVADTNGVFSLFFDNSFSWIRSKTVWYKQFPSIKKQIEMSEIGTLVAQHQQDITTLRSLLHDVINESHDDLWLLRYILSNKTPEAAEAAARFTIDYFTKNKDLIDTVLSGGKLPFQDTIAQYQCSGSHKFTKNGEPVFYVRIGISNDKALMDTVPYQDVLNFMISNNIKIMKACDKASREQQKIVKAIGVIDFLHISRVPDSRFFKILGESSKMSEKMFPQLMGKNIYVNAPSAVVWTFGTVLKPLLSKKTVEKTVFCPGKGSKKGIAECPYLARYLDLENVPSFLGGGCECNDGCCIGGMPNSQTTPVTVASCDGFTSLVVSTRGSESVDTPVLEGATIRYELRVADKQNIKVLAVFKSGGLSGADVDVVDKRSIEGKDGVVSAEFIASSNGVFSLHFDNSFAWFRSKNVWYKIDYDGKKGEE
ncbi:hypothetical protein HDU98_001785 [Podochytrium sp. JEL0797]|nr:hypothetical protein HDU98_001785 [Podochytrium sp. JEL0797]